MDKFQLMRRSFELAKKGLGSTWPNPLVGAILVKENRIIGEGFHQKYGAAHAEVEAINNSIESPEGSTLFVNLEPCCHLNKQTPPCAQRLIKEKIKKVIICNHDPNPEVYGKGIELLKSAGIEVEIGLLEAEGELLNEVFFHAQRKQRPFVHLKLATTLDGKIALPSGESQWITGVESRAYVHVLRSEHQAVMIGAKTLRQDNPTLNVRIPHYAGKQPYRIVITQSGDIDPKSKLFTDDLHQQTIVYSHNEINLSNVEVVKIHSLQDVLSDLYQRKIITILLEGGAELASSFIKEGLVDRVSLFMNPSFLGEGKQVLGDLDINQLNQRPMLKNIQHTNIGEDIYITGKF